MKKWTALILVLLLCAWIPAFAEELPLSPCIRLNGNPTTGYTWTYEISRPEVLSVAEEYTADDAPTGKLGAGGEYAFLLNGVSEGTATVTFTYARSWENKQPAYTLVYRVSVDEGLNAVILESAFEN